MRIQAIIYGTEQIACELIVVPYGLYVIRNEKRDYEWEQILIARSRQMLTDEVLEELKERSMKILSKTNKFYPKRLLNIHNPPLKLYVEGTKTFSILRI